MSCSLRSGGYEWRPRLSRRPECQSESLLLRTVVHDDAGPPRRKKRIRLHHIVAAVGRRCGTVVWRCAMQHSETDKSRHAVPTDRPRAHSREELKSVMLQGSPS